MEYPLIMKLLDDGVIDIQKLFLSNYQSIGLGETGAFIAIELYNRSKKGERLLNPEKLSKDLGIAVDLVAPVLESLMKQDLLSIEMVTGPNGKEHETYNMNKAIVKILAEIERKMAATSVAPKVYATTVEELVDIIETGFQKQLTPLEVEIIKKWVNEDRFDLLEIRKAVLDAVKANKHTLSYVDTLLVRRKSRAKGETAVKYDAGQPEALKNFFDSWPKK